MQTERNKDGTYNVWMAREEYRRIPAAAEPGERSNTVFATSACYRKHSNLRELVRAVVARKYQRHHERGDGS